MQWSSIFHHVPLFFHGESWGTTKQHGTISRSLGRQRRTVDLAVRHVHALARLQGGSDRAIAVTSNDWEW